MHVHMHLEYLGILQVDSPEHLSQKKKKHRLTCSSDCTEISGNKHVLVTSLFDLLALFIIYFVLLFSGGNCLDLKGCSHVISHWF